MLAGVTPAGVMLAAAASGRRGTNHHVLFPGNPLLLTSALPPDVTERRAYSAALGLQDAADKELFDSLPDIKVRGSFVLSLGVAERAELHAKAADEPFPRDPRGDCSLIGPFSPGAQAPLTTAGVFGHEGGRLVAPNTGEPPPSRPHSPKNTLIIFSSREANAAK